jgi:hypothetical protein
MNVLRKQVNFKLGNTQIGGAAGIELVSIVWVL